jgi:hypothetical protein
MATLTELNAKGTEENGIAELALDAAKTAMRNGYDIATQAYAEGHIGGGDAAELRDLYGVAEGKIAEALMAVRAVHKAGTKVAIKTDKALKPTGTYADLPPLNEGVTILGGGR